MTLTLDGDTDVFVLIDTLDLTVPDCDDCHKAMPLRWLATHHCQCPEEFLICHPCRQKFEQREMMVALTDGYFWCNVCGDRSKDLSDLVTFSPLP